MIYESTEAQTNFSQIYILMIILLIFSQDDVNNETIQKVVSLNMGVVRSYKFFLRCRWYITSLGLRNDPF